jgi:hypothetical protein
MNQRCKCIERVGKEKARFECPKGHRFVDYMLSKKQRRVAKNTNLDFLARWWKNGVYMECPECKEKTA